MTALNSSSTTAPTSPTASAGSQRLPRPAPRTPSTATQLLRVVLAELIKLRSVRSTGYLSLALALSLIVVGLVNAVGIAVHAAQQPGSVDAGDVDPTGAALSGLGTAVVVAATAGVLAVTGDYTAGTIRTTMAAVPRRSRLLLGKTSALVIVTFPVALGSALLSFVGAQVTLAQVELSISFWHPGVARAVLGAALYLTAVAVLGAGLGWLIRSTAGALAVWAALWIVPSLLVMVLPPPLAARVSPYLPGNAGTTLAQVTGDSALATWSSFGALVLYALVATAAALLTLVRRDA